MIQLSTQQLPGIALPVARAPGFGATSDFALALADLVTPDGAALPAGVAVPGQGVAVAGKDLPVADGVETDVTSAPDLAVVLPVAVTAGGVREQVGSPLPFRGGAGGGGSPQATPLVDRPHPNPSPEGEGLSRNNSSSIAPMPSAPMPGMPKVGAEIPAPDDEPVERDTPPDAVAIAAPPTSDPIMPVPPQPPVIAPQPERDPAKPLVLAPVAPRSMPRSTAAIGKVPNTPSSDAGVRQESEATVVDEAPQHRPANGAVRAEPVAAPVHYPSAVPAEPRPAVSPPVAPLAVAPAAAAPVTAITPVPPPPPPIQPAAHVFAAAMFAAVERRTDEPADDLSFALIPAAVPAATYLPVVAVQAPDQAQQPTLDLSGDGWMTSMIDHIETLRDDGGALDRGSVRETRMKLSPAALGGVEVSVRRDDAGAIQVRIAADTPQARALLADAAPRLAEIAEARGLKLGGSGVDHHAGHHRRDTPTPHPTMPVPAAPRAQQPGDTTTDTRLA